MKMINIATEFSKTPFGRYKADSPYSAESFREKILKPAFDEAKDGDKITVDFKGISLGLGSSFLEEAFGGLIRMGVDKNKVLNTLVIVSNFPTYENQIFGFIRLAQSGGDFEK